MRPAETWWLGEVAVAMVVAGILGWLAHDQLVDRPIPELDEALPVVEAVPCDIHEEPHLGRDGHWLWITECAAGVRPVVVTFTSTAEVPR